MKEDTAHFFHPDYERDLGDPLLLPNMDRAVERMAQALKNNEKVALFCDYDADGVTAATVLTDFLKGLAGLRDVPVHLPDRIKEGYGLNRDAIDRFKEEGVRLMITADLGVSNQPEIQYAKDKGIDTIVLDHHLPPPDLNPEWIIVDPKIEGNRYPFDAFCAAGVSFNFVRAFVKTHPELLPHYTIGQEKWMLDMVAIGTVADCMPLIQENRALVTFGLKVIHKARRKGLNALLANMNMDPKQVNARTLGFSLAPRINAAGRLKHANTAYELLTGTDEARIAQLVQEVETTNTERRSLTEEITIQAMDAIGDPGNRSVLIAAGEGWSQGVVGIVAGRITERYARPTFVFSIREDGLVTGSARSVKGFNIVDAIRSQKDLLETFGGHAMAAGCSMKRESFEAFTEGISQYVSQRLDASELTKTLEIDMELALTDVDWELANLVLDFEPTGIANPTPIFMTSNVEVVDVRAVGEKGDHLKMRLRGWPRPNDASAVVATERDAELDPDMPVRCRASSCLMESIGFGLGGYAHQLRPGDTVDIAYEVDINEWNGTRTLQLRLVDIREAGSGRTQQMEADADLGIE